MFKFCFLTTILCFNSFAEELPRLQKRGKCLFFVSIEKYVQETVEVSVKNGTVYLKGVEDLAKEGDPYFYYKFDIPPECKKEPQLGFTESGINILLGR